MIALVKHAFQPGFRLSIIDVLFLILGAWLVWNGWGMTPALGVVVACPFIAFFLFCNVFRIRRIPELVWAGIFLTAVPIWHVMQVHIAWLLSVLLVALVAVIANDLRHPSYHGMWWKRINPGLPDWHARNRSIR